MASASSPDAAVPSLGTLLDMLTYRRPHDGPGEHAFIERFLLPLGAHHALTRVGTSGNVVVRVPFPDGSALTTLFSAHTDTVHGPGDTRQAPVVDEASRVARAPDGDILGADDAAGVWLLLELIAAGVPGVYCFHRAEEIGRQGSREIAAEHADVLRGIRRAVAFDRKGCTSVITHQRGERCCSDAFATALGAALHAADPHLSFAPDPTGSFTDTASYVALVPECTNVSCGYHDAHLRSEWLDLTFLAQLRNALVQVDWEGLPTLRNPAEATVHPGA
jgi:hypothetical protein